MNLLHEHKIREVYAVVFQLLGKRNQLIEGNDFKSLSELSDQLHTVFQVLNEDVDISRTSHFKTIEHNIELALNALGSDKNENADIESSFVFFRCAEQNAVQAFQTATNFEGKSLATKVIILTTLYLNDYFLRTNSSAPCSEVIKSQCHQRFQMLLDTPEVKNAIEAESSRNVFISIRPTSTKAVRSEIYSELSNIRYCIYKYTSLACPVLNAQNQPVELTWMPKSIQAHKDAVTNVILLDKSLISTSTDGIVNVWDKSKFTLVASMDCEAPVNCLNLANGTLYVGTDRGLQLWDFQRHVKISHIPQYEGCRVYSLKLLSGNGQQDLCVSFDGQIDFLSLRSDSLHESTPHQPQGVFHHVVCLGERDERVFWHEIDAEGVSSLRVYSANFPLSVEPLHSIVFDTAPNCVCLSEKFLCAKSRGAEGAIRVWSVNDLSVVTNLTVPSVHSSTTIFQSDLLHTSHHRLYAYCAASEVVRIFNLETLSEVGDVVLKKNYQLTSLHASPEGDLFAGLSDGKLKEWASDIVMESIICAKALLLREEEKTRLATLSIHSPSSLHLVASPALVVKVPVESESSKSNNAADISSVASTYGGSNDGRYVEQVSPTCTPPVTQYARHISFAQSPLDRPSACHRAEGDMIDEGSQCDCSFCNSCDDLMVGDTEKYALYNNGGVIAMVVMTLAWLAVL